MVGVQWFAESALGHEVLGSIPVPSILFSRKGTVLKFAFCSLKRMEDKERLGPNFT